MKTILDWVKSNHVTVANLGMIQAAINLAILKKEPWWSAALQVGAILYPSLFSQWGVKVPPIPPATGV